MNDVFFSIIIDCCNQEEWVERCIGSCLGQKYKNFEVILLDALSDDNTFKIAKKYEKDFKNFKAFQNEIRKPQIANILELTKLSKENSVCVSVDGDDWLKNSQVLNKLNNIYKTKNVWMTYGSYEEFPYRSVKFHYHEYPEEVIKNNSFREYKWLASHLRTYKRELFLKINESDFKRKDGEWLDTAGDQAFMLPMLEMSSERSFFVDDILLIYNVANQKRDGALNESRQVELAKYVRSLKKYNRLNNL
jgi:glycosyltransferase involved in cell wall biosynthesis